MVNDTFFWDRHGKPLPQTFGSSQCSSQSIARDSHCESVCVHIWVEIIIGFWLQNRTRLRYCHQKWKQSREWRLSNVARRAGNAGLSWTFILGLRASQNRYLETVSSCKQEWKESEAAQKSFQVPECMHTYIPIAEIQRSESPTLLAAGWMRVSAARHLGSWTLDPGPNSKSFSCNATTYVKSNKASFQPEFCL